MSKVAISGDSSGTGTFTIKSPNSNSDRTLNLPDNSGTVLTTATPGVPVNGPAFSAYLSATQNLTAATFTKVTIDTETFDVGACFDTATSRFTANVAGYYWVTAAISFNSTSNNPTNAQAYIYKNGSEVKSAAGASATSRFSGVVTGIIYLNGTTDYLEAYAFAAGGTGTLYVQATSSAYTYFDACLIRSAV
jgi:hypothetical protein